MRPKTTTTQRNFELCFYIFHLNHTREREKNVPSVWGENMTNSQRYVNRNGKKKN